MTILDSANVFNFYRTDGTSLQVNTWDICNENITRVNLPQDQI